MDTAQRNLQYVARWAGVKRIIATILSSPFCGMIIRNFYSQKVPHHGLIIKVPEACHSSIPASLYWGFYESAERRFINEFLTDAYDVIEFGSSIGVISCLIASKLNAKRLMICVEANPKLIPYLKYNILTNSPDQPIEIINAAIVGSTSCSDPIFFQVSDDIVSSKIVDNPELKNVFQVDGISLASVLQRAKSIDKKFSDYVLICDIEGAELLIFKYDHISLSTCRMLIIELHQVENEIFYAVEDMIKIIHGVSHLRIKARYGNVCVFK